MEENKTFAIRSEVVCFFLQMFYFETSNQIREKLLLENYVTSEVAVSHSSVYQPLPNNLYHVRFYAKI